VQIRPPCGKWCCAVMRQLQISGSRPGSRCSGVDVQRTARATAARGNGESRRKRPEHSIVSTSYDASVTSTLRGAHLSSGTAGQPESGRPSRSGTFSDKASPTWLRFRRRHLAVRAEATGRTREKAATFCTVLESTAATDVVPSGGQSNVFVGSSRTLALGPPRTVCTFGRTTLFL